MNKDQVKGRIKEAEGRGKGSCWKGYRQRHPGAERQAAKRQLARRRQATVTSRIRSGKTTSLSSVRGRIPMAAFPLPNGVSCERSFTISFTDSRPCSPCISNTGTHAASRPPSLLLVNRKLGRRGRKCSGRNNVNRIHSIIAVATIAMLLLMLDGCATTTAGVGYEALLATRFSRTGESEANRIGLELAARSGYDPRAGITL